MFNHLLLLTKLESEELQTHLGGDVLGRFVLQIKNNADLSRNYGGPYSIEDGEDIKYTRDI